MNGRVIFVGIAVKKAEGKKSQEGSGICCCNRYY